MLQKVQIRFLEKKKRMKITQQDRRIRWINFQDPDEHQETTIAISQYYEWIEYQIRRFEKWAMNI